MNANERVMLQDFLGKLVSVNNISKDAEADAMIHQAMTRQPDAPYVLVQNMLLMQHALTELNARVAELERQNQGGSFLGSESQNAVKSYFKGGAGQQQAQPAYSQPYAQQSSGMGDFLRSAGTTAAGVAGGMLLFEGISHLFSPSASAFGGGSSFLGGTPNITENITNNYYGGDSSGGDFLDDSDISDAFDGGDSVDLGFDDSDVF
jgi:uncharacterized protein